MPASAALDQGVLLLLGQDPVPTLPGFGNLGNLVKDSQREDDRVAVHRAAGDLGQLLDGRPVALTDLHGQGVGAPRANGHPRTAGDLTVPGISLRLRSDVGLLGVGLTDGIVRDAIRVAEQLFQIETIRLHRLNPSFFVATCQAIP
jgi:hypothetical protein